MGALLFIIYMGDAMGDLEALNRRSRLPIRIIQDRQQEQNNASLWGAIKADEDNISKYRRRGRS